MFEALQSAAILCSALFAGAALYINLVEHPARLQCGTELAATVFGPSYKRATLMQVPLAIVATISAIRLLVVSWIGPMDRGCPNDIRCNALYVGCDYADKQTVAGSGVAARFGNGASPSGTLGAPACCAKCCEFSRNDHFPSCVSEPLTGSRRPPAHFHVLPKNC